MKRYLLDTGPLAALLMGRLGAVALIRPWIVSHQVATSILVYGEVIEHLLALPNYSRHYTGLQNLLADVYPYFLTYRILERYASVRRQLRPPQGPGLIGDVDTLIAATALERKLSVVTTDSDFQKVPGLQVMLLPREALRASK